MSNIDPIELLKSQLAYSDLALLDVDSLRALESIVSWEMINSRPEQIAPPDNDWEVWLILAGRGWGKTRTNAQWAVREAWRYPKTITHVIARTSEDHRKTTFGGPSGLFAVTPPEIIRKRTTTPFYMELTNGSSFLAFTSAEPEALRGPQSHRALADELAAWKYPDDTWDQIMFSNRLPMPDGSPNRVAVSTTPKPIKLVRELLKSSKDEPDRFRVTRGSTYDNSANLSRQFLSALEKKYRGTRLEAQELHAKLLMDVPGALWSWEQIEKCKVYDIPDLARVVVAVDPPASSEEDSNECGLVVAGVAVGPLPVGYLLADRSDVLSPDEWGKRAVMMYDEWDGDEIVIEVNQGGEMAKQTLVHAAADLWRNGLRPSPYVNIRAVHASRGKIVRAEPVSMLHAQGLIKHVMSPSYSDEGMPDKFPNPFERLEEQLTSFTSDIDRKKSGSPDRLDAYVWAFTSLMLKAQDNIDILSSVGRAIVQAGSAPSNWRDVGSRSKITESRNSSVANKAETNSLRRLLQRTRKV